ncbi:hypothetical protein OG698_47595 [Streptomyces sp. NBC_01003]|uniref:hypothetical protein n=1 Tax=Streptomyces sp. NBC_01003 TaxID=2903714 RepID=UPI00387065F5|nr:hypothetical protein OG698_47595 [Streptomyces sp. NBC_01003]
MTKAVKTQAQDNDDRGLSGWGFAALMLGAFVAVALFALLGGWPGLAGIVVTVVLLTGFAAHRL